jgi:DNA-binding winged helix-turn-helix (wHTH) protein
MPDGSVETGAIVPTVQFGDFILDGPKLELRRAGEPLSIQAKAFGMLQYLIANRDRVVSKDELLDAVWADSAVSEASLTTGMSQIRRVLGDDRLDPRFVATVHGRGYRFIADVREGADLVEAAEVVAGDRHSLVGRDEDLQRLRSHLGAAIAQRRRVVFVTGDLGIGKTTLLEAFANEVAVDEPSVRVARGQCISQVEGGEPYLPFIDALARLCRASDGEQSIEVLRQYAPSILAQMPDVLDRDERQTLRDQLPGRTPEHVLRVLAEAVDQLTADQPIVLLLEDLHWADHASIELLSTLAQRSDPARLMIVASYRPVELILDRHPLRSTKILLDSRDACEEVALVGLDSSAVSAYVRREFPGLETADAVSDELFARSRGNPLFLVRLAEHLVEQGWLERREEGWALTVDVADVGTSLPPSLQRTIEAQIEELTDPDERLIGAAAVIGEEFLAVDLAAVADQVIDDVEAACTELSRCGQFLKLGEDAISADGVATTRYAFRHALFSQTAYERLPAVRKRNLHGRVVDRLEGVLGDSTVDLSAVLAVHSERAGDTRRAIEYRKQAAAAATRGAAQAEARLHIQTALRLTQLLPKTPERDFSQIMLEVDLAGALIAGQGYAAPELGEALSRASELAKSLGDTPIYPIALDGLSAYHFGRAEIQLAREMAEQARAIGRRAGCDDATLAQITTSLANAKVHSGMLADAHREFAEAVEYYDEQPEGAMPDGVSAYWVEPRAICEVNLCALLSLSGRPDEGLEREARMLDRAHQLGHPFSLAMALSYSGFHRMILLDADGCRRLGKEALALSQQHGFAYWGAWGVVLPGWASLMADDWAGGIDEMRAGIAALDESGSVLGVDYARAWLGLALSKTGDPWAGWKLVEQILAAMRAREELLEEPDMLRIQADIAADLEAAGETSPIPQAALLESAIERAAEQGSVWLGLRAAARLAKLWLGDGRSAEAAALLEPRLASFPADTDLPAVRSARELLAQGRADRSS